MSASESAGAFCRPGRLMERGVGAEKGVSDPASRASGSALARRAGSLTPRVCVQIRPDKCGPDRGQIGAHFGAPFRIMIAPVVVLAIDVPRCRTVVEN